MAIAIVVVALLAIGGFLVFGGDVPLISDGPTGPGEFSFDLKKVEGSATSGTPPADLKDTVREAGTGVKETMDELYFAAFVDQDSWGDYGAAFELFEGSAAARAESDQEVLTLGPTAGQDFESIDATSGTLTISVLTDDQDAPVSAVADVEFEATVQGADGGTSTQVVGAGSYFLRQVDGAWRIFAYDVDRDDVEAEAPSPSGSPS